MPLISDNLGECAAIATALCWVFTSLAFAAAGRRVGPAAVNLSRLLLAVVLLACVHRLVFGTWAPTPDRRGVWLLAISGIIGLALGDQCLFTAFVDVGPRTAALLMTLAPPVTAVIAWPVLGESVTWTTAIGISVTLAGIAWVIIERPRAVAAHRHVHRARGIVLGVIAAVCQAVGIVLAKLGIGHTRLDEADLLDPWSATLVRMAFAAVAMGVIMGGLRLARPRESLDRMMDLSPESEHLPRRPGTPPGHRRRSALGFIVIGTVFGPVIGVWLSLVAVDRADAGIATTLMAMTPVFILPFAVWIEKERIGWRAVIGAVVAVGGVVVLAVQ